MLPLVLSAGLALVHLLAGRLRFLEATPRSRTLSAAGGISVAYVFAHLLPEVAAGQEALAEAGLRGGVLDGSHAWLLALAGLVVFYGLEQLAQRSRERSSEGGDRTEAEVFWVHMGSYGLYNVLVGYLLAADPLDAALVSRLTFAAAMALHFLVNDVGLRDHHKARYTAVGRYVLATAVVGGAGLGLAGQVPESLIAGLVAFLAGSVVLNVLKEELPDERESRFWPFAAGAFGFAALLAAV
ncbi:hypothetical protein [Rubrivirga sp. IMCC43871]|uniref:hypothetical protein n=1 Tax=Rubrivirga sp. IMCC43871 TaxID=3391575 RepID=UPI00398FF97F